MSGQDRKRKRASKSFIKIGFRVESMEGAFEKLSELTGLRIVEDVEQSFENLNKDRQDLFGVVFNNKEIRGIIEKDGTPKQQGRVIYGKVTPETSCWGTGIPCITGFPHLSINHEVEHVVDCTRQTLLAILPQRNKVASKGVYATHSSLLRELLGKFLNVSEEYIEEEVSSIKEGLTTINKLLIQPSCKGFNQGKCREKLLRVRLKRSSDKNTTFPLPVLRLDTDVAEVISQRMYGGAQNIFKKGICSAFKLTDSRSGITGGYTDKDQKKKAERIMDGLETGEFTLEGIISEKSKEIEERYNEVDSLIRQTSMAFSILLTFLIFISTYIEVEEVKPNDLVIPDSFIRLVKLSMEFLKELYSKKYPIGMSTEETSSSYNMKVVDNPSDDKENEPPLKRVRNQGGGSPPDMRPSEPGSAELINPEHKRELFKELSDVEELTPEEYDEVTESYLEEVTDMMILASEDLEEEGLGDILSEGVSIDKIVAGAPTKKKKKQSKKKKKQKKQPKKQTRGKPKKQPKKKKQTKKNKPKKKQSKREIVIDLSGLRELVT